MKIPSIYMLSLLLDEEYVEGTKPLFNQKIAPGVLRPISDIMRFTDAKLIDVTGKKLSQPFGQGEGSSVVEPRPKEAGKFYDNNSIVVIIDQDGHTWVTNNADKGLITQLERGGYKYASTNVPLSNQERIIGHDGKMEDPNWAREPLEDDTPFYKQQAQEVAGKQLRDKYTNNQF